MGTMANNEDPDEMQHNAAFHQNLHCLLMLSSHQRRFDGALKRRAKRHQSVTKLD